MKKIIVTPAGRKKYLEILLENLKKVRNEFDYWDIWINTNNQEDIDYIEKISKENDFINLKYLTVPYNGNLSIYSFFKDYVNPDEIYLRLDDDIVYIEKNSIKELFQQREKDSEHFLLYGNIINNAVITHIHQRNGNFPYSDGIVNYICMDDVGWKNPLFAEKIHNITLEKIKNKKSKDLHIKNWILYFYERVSINVISWRGDDFLKFNGNVGLDEEQWLSSDYPSQIKKPNKIIGNTLFVHYSFYTQRDYIDKTNILEQYKEISNGK